MTQPQTPKSARTILLIEDDPDAAEYLRTLLHVYKFRVIEANGGKEGLRLARQQRPDLIILDIMLPDMDGFQVCNTLRKTEESKQIPIIIVSARDQVHDKVFGFELGADDYVTKPIQEEELIARVGAKIRRAEENFATNFLIQRGALRIDLYAHKVFVNEEELPIKTLELYLLKYLMENEGLVLSRAQILDNVWGNDSNVNDRTVDAHIYSLRKKHRVISNAIETVYGGGYRFRTPETEG
ncbi:MAG: response regulator transcription factor [Myxococcales bacterium]|nr:response regulator transcription factor [Myxococcales bacterium]